MARTEAELSLEPHVLSREWLVIHQIVVPTSELQDLDVTLGRANELHQKMTMFATQRENITLCYERDQLIEKADEFLKQQTWADSLQIGLDNETWTMVPKMITKRQRRLTRLEDATGHTTLVLQDRPLPVNFARD